MTGNFSDFDSVSDSNQYSVKNTTLDQDDGTGVLAP